MRKIGFSILFLLLTITGIFYYLKIRKDNSFKNSVHKKAVIIIKIGADNLKKDLFFSYLKNDLFKAGKTSKVKKQNLGLEIPANLILFSVHSNQHSLYTKFNISDLKNFKRFIGSKKFKAKLLKISDGIIYQSVFDNRLIIAYNNNRLAICLNQNNEADYRVLQDLLNNQNYLQEDDNRLKTLKNTTDHVTMLSDSINIRYSFNNGNIEINGSINNEFSKTNNNLKFRKSNENAVVKVFISGYFNRIFFGRTLKIKDTELAADSLLDKNSSVDFEINGTASQQDSILTYTYNDDFEKVSELKTVNKKVPLLSVYLQTDRPVKDYLLNKNILLKNNQVNKSMFPLYQLFWNQTNTGIHLSTGKTQLLEAVFEDSYVFYCDINFDKLRKQDIFPEYKYALTKFEQLLITAFPSQNKIIIKGKLNFSNKQQNALLQLTEGLF